MKLLRIASRATFLAVFLGTVADTPVVADSPAEQIVNSANPSPAPTPWYDNLFQQKLPVDFGFRLGESHSDNIYFQPKKTADYITELSPSVVFTLGQPITLVPQLDQETIDDRTDSAHSNYLQVTYRPTLTLYANNSFLDVVDEYADAIFTHQFAKLTLSLEQTYEKLSQPTLQINAEGTLIHRDIFTTTAKANYIYSDQLSTYATFTQTVNSYISNSYTDNTEWVGDYYFLYQLFPKLSVGLGPRIGFDDIAQAPNQESQAGLVHLYFAASGKVHFSAAVGGELREFENDSSPEKFTPIFEASGTYQPFDSMTIKLDGERHRIVSNGQIGTDYTATVASLEVRQRFFQIIYLTFAGGYEDDQYTGPVAFGPARDDGFYYLRGGLEWESYRGIKITAGYEYLRDDSNIKAFTFNESRATVSASIKY